SAARLATREAPVDGGRVVLALARMRYGHPGYSRSPLDRTSVQSPDARRGPASRLAGGSSLFTEELSLLADSVPPGASPLPGSAQSPLASGGSLSGAAVPDVSGSTLP